MHNAMSRTLTHAAGKTVPTQDETPLRKKQNTRNITTPNSMNEEVMIGKRNSSQGPMLEYTLKYGAPPQSIDEIVVNEKVIISEPKAG